MRLAALIGRNKKKSIGGGIAGAIIGILLFILSIAQGPFQLIHLGQVLSKNWAGQEDATTSRFRGMFRYAKTGDIGQTRVGYFGSKYVAKTLNQLKEVGVEFPDRTSLGRFKTLSIDTAVPGSPWEGLPDDKARARIISDLELPDDGRGILSKRGSKFIINVDPTTVKGIKFSRFLASTSVGLLDDGTIITAMKDRIMRRYFGLPNLFSPISSRATAAIEKLFDKAERKKAEKDRTKPRTNAVNSKFGAARGRLASRIQGHEGKLVGVLSGTGALCLIRDVADDAIEVNHGIATASAIEAVDKQAVGSTAQYKIDPLQAGAVAESFIDEEGRSIWEAKALDATAKGGAGKGEDAPVEYAQAFSKDTTANNIRDTVAVETETPLGSIDFTGAICSTAGLVIQGGANIVLLLATPITGGGSLAAFAAKQGASIAATAGVLYLLQKKLTAILANDSLVEIPPSGPIGGNVLAYGARWASNITAVSSGGVALDDSESIITDRRFEQKERQEFQSRSFFARIFDPYDYRSLTSQVIQKTSPDPGHNISNIASSVAGISGMVSSLFSTITPSAGALTLSEENYLWPFPRYGIPSKLLNDPALEDPTGNAEKVADILKRNDEYIGRAKTCFGVEIGPGPRGLDAIATEEVFPNSQDYIDADCNHTDNPDWRRIMLFVFDTRMVTTVECYEGDEEACSNIGMEEASVAGGPVGGGGDDGGSVPGDFTIKKYSPALNSPGGKINPKGVTLHWWSFGGGIDALVDGLRSNPTCSGGCSVQFAITNNGEIYQMTADEKDLTYHAFGGNETTFGIEMEGGPEDFGREGKNKYPKKFEAAVFLVKYLKDKYGLQINGSTQCKNVAGIHSHKQLNHCQPSGIAAKTDIDDFYYNEIIRAVRGE
jgi:hypothetical protein